MNMIADRFNAYKQNATDECKSRRCAAIIHTLLETSDRAVIEFERFPVMGIHWCLVLSVRWASISLHQVERPLSRFSFRPK
jgi:hypothetical protein